MQLRKTRPAPVLKVEKNGSSFSFMTHRILSFSELLRAVSYFSGNHLVSGEYEQIFFLVLSTPCNLHDC